MPKAGGATAISAALPATVVLLANSLLGDLKVRSCVVAALLLEMEILKGELGLREVLRESIIFGFVEWFLGF